MAGIPASTKSETARMLSGVISLGWLNCVIRKNGALSWRLIISTRSFVIRDGWETG